MDVGESLLKVHLNLKMKITFAEVVSYKVTTIGDALTLKHYWQHEDEDADLPKEIVVPSDVQKCRVGRLKSNGCRLKSDSISGKHVYITCKDECFVLKGAKTSNGTTVQVIPETKTTVQFYDFTVEFKYSRPVESSSSDDEGQ